MTESAASATFAKGLEGVLVPALAEAAEGVKRVAATQTALEQAISALEEKLTALEAVELDEGSALATATVQLKEARGRVQNVAATLKRVEARVSRLEKASGTARPEL